MENIPMEKAYLIHNHIHIFILSNPLHLVPRAWMQHTHFNTNPLKPPVAPAEPAVTHTHQHRNPLHHSARTPIATDLWGKLLSDPFFFWWTLSGCRLAWRSLWILLVAADVN